MYLVDQNVDNVITNIRITCVNVKPTRLLWVRPSWHYMNNRLICKQIEPQKSIHIKHYRQREPGKALCKLCSNWICFKISLSGFALAREWETPLIKDFLYAKLISFPRPVHVNIQQNEARLAATEKLDRHCNRGGSHSHFLLFLWPARLKRIVLFLH
jgi:hypothetical protein